MPVEIKKEEEKDVKQEKEESKLELKEKVSLIFSLLLDILSVRGQRINTHCKEK